MPDKIDVTNQLYWLAKAKEKFGYVDVSAGFPIEIDGYLDDSLQVTLVQTGDELANFLDDIPGHSNQPIYRENTTLQHQDFLVATGMVGWVHGFKTPNADTNVIFIHITRLPSDQLVQLILKTVLVRLVRVEFGSFNRSFMGGLRDKGNPIGEQNIQQFKQDFLESILKYIPEVSEQDILTHCPSLA